jgi:hypothetical protein
MAYFALFYDYGTDDSVADRRKPYREAHMAMVSAAERDGRLVLAGPFKPADGALLVFRAETAGDVEQFAARDPYVTSGIVKFWRVREWSVVAGDGAARNVG